MNKNNFKKLLILLLLANLIVPVAVFAEEAEFNPNHIISDADLQNWQCMNRTDIQAFLEEKNSFLAQYRIEDTSNTRRLASDIISQAAQQYQINPKYLLVKLQKEQSLITTPNPSPTQLDWATGYGVCDSCSMFDTTIQKFKGFTAQVDNAAGVMRWYYDNVNNLSWIKRPDITYNIDNIVVRPANLATAFLYTYTPHMLGNKNFWKLWQTWFSQVYPDGTLIKTATNDVIYLLQEGKKRAFANKTALVTRADPKLVVTVPESEINRYETGSTISFANYSILKQGNNYYLLDYDTLRPFASEAVVRTLGYNPEEIIDVETNDLIGYSLGETITASTTAPAGRLLKIKENQQIYFIKDGKLHPIYDEAVAKNNFSNLKIESGKVTDLAGLTRAEPVLLKDGTLFGVKGSNWIYVAEKGKKRHIADEEVFNGLAYNWKNVIWINDFAGEAHADGQPVYLSREIQSTGSTGQLATEPTTKTVGDSAAVEPKNSVIANPKMVITPTAEVKYIGEKFNTTVDAYLVADYETGKVLLGKNIDWQRPLASFTKTLTALKLMETGLDLKKIVTYNPVIHNCAYNNYRLTAGEMVRNRDIMDSFLVSSLNGPAYMLIDSLGMKPTDFVTKLNQQVKDWGLTQTTFVDPAGTSEKNLTTPYEYLTIFTNSLKNTTVKEYLAKPSYSYDEILDIDGKPTHLDNHSNLLVGRKDLNFKIDASKTGYMDESGANLVMLVTRPTDNKKFIIITMGNPDYANRFDEPKRLTDWVINNF